MSNTSKLMASFCFAALLLILGSIYVHNAEGFPKHLDTVMALIGGFIGLMTAAFGFAGQNDNPWGS